MPYGSDDWLHVGNEIHEQAQKRIAKENDLRLRERLRKKFRVSKEFMDLAVRIWWDGKED